MLRKILIALALFGMMGTAPVRADSPASTVVRDFYSHLSGTIKQGEQLGFQGRYEKLDPAIRTAFNLPLMTKMSVGSQWAGASQQEQAALVDAFSAFSIATYASRFVSDDGLLFTVVSEKPSESGIIVETKLKPKDGDAITLNYLMRPDDKGQYRIVDVYMNGTISELATRRAEFSGIARREGVPALINSLGQKAKTMGQS